MFRTKETEGS